MLMFFIITAWVYCFYTVSFCLNTLYRFFKNISVYPYSLTDSLAIHKLSVGIIRLFLLIMFCIFWVLYIIPTYLAWQIKYLWTNVLSYPTYFPNRILTLSYLNYRVISIFYFFRFNSFTGFTSQPISPLFYKVLVQL